MCIFPRFERLSPFPIVLFNCCKSKKINPNSNYVLYRIFTKKSALANTFHKYERLCSKKQIDTLFEKGQTQIAYPIKLISLAQKTELKLEVKAMFVVPKKKFKNANDRNTLKRRMREAYRLQKGGLYDLLPITKLNLAFLYYGSKSEDYDVISKAVAKLLNNLTKENGTNGKPEAK